MSVHPTEPLTTATPSLKPRPPLYRRWWAIVIYMIGLFIIGIEIGLAGHTTAAANPAPPKVVTVTVSPSPSVITVTASPAQPPAGTKLGSWSGSGNQNTPPFSAPASGDYVVKWTFSGNTDSFGNGSNFIINDTDSQAQSFGLPNAIGGSGSGSTEVTGASGTESFNVQSAGSWTITVTSAP